MSEVNTATAAVTEKVVYLNFFQGITPQIVNQFMNICTNIINQYEPTELYFFIASS